jgi:hypothetical protein
MKYCKLPIAVIIFLALTCHHSTDGCFVDQFLLPHNAILPTMAVVGENILFAGGYVDNQQTPTNIIDIYNPTTNRWTVHTMNKAREGMTAAVVGSILLLAGGWEKSNWNDNQLALSSLVEIIDFEKNVSWTAHLSSIRQVSAVSAGGKVLFYTKASQITTIDIFDLATNTSQVVQRGFYWTASAVGDDIYFFRNSEVEIYHPSNNTWTNESLGIDILGDLIDSFVIKDDIYLITARSIFIRRYGTTRWQLISLGFGHISYRLVHYDVLYMMVGPSRTRINTVFTLDGLTGKQLSWDYEPYNFGIEGNVIAHQDRLYFVGWSANAIQRVFPQVLVYDAIDTRHRLVPLPNDDYQLQQMHEHKGKLFLINREATLPSIFIYDLLLATWSQFSFDDPRSGIMITSSGGHVVFYGGTYGDNNVSKSVHIYNTDTGAWDHHNTTVSAKYAVIHNGWLIFYGSVHGEATHHVDVFHIESKTWTAHSLASSSNDYFTVIFGSKVALLAKDVLLSVDVFDTSTQSWTEFYLRTPRSDFTHISVNGMIFIACGITLDPVTFTNSLEAYNLNTLRFAFERNLSDARAKPVAAVSFPYVVFACGARNGFPVSAIDVYNMEEDSLRQTTFRRPELIGSDFGIASVGNTMYIRYNNYLWMLRLSTLELTQPVATPFMAGGRNFAIGNNLVFYGQSDFLEVFYFWETTTGEHFQMATPYLSEAQTTLVWKNFLVIYLGDLVIIELSTVWTALTDHDLFIGESTTLAAAAVGNGLEYFWYHESTKLDEMRPFLFLNTSSPTFREGRYWLTIKDHCRSYIDLYSIVKMLGAPTFLSELDDRTVLCNTTAMAFQLTADGRNVSLDWKINDESVAATDNTTFLLDIRPLTCDSTNRLCATASNPSGSVSTCSDIHLVSLGSIFNGPRMSPELQFRSVGSYVTIRVDILDDRCQNHTWFRDGEELGSFNATYSELDVTLQRNVESERYVVVTTCDGSNLVSAPLIITLSPLPAFGLALILILGTGLIVAAIVVGVIVRRRFKRSQKQEVELKTMLNKAKQEVITKNGTTIINTTSWEWSPDDEHTFCPLDRLPVNVDLSNLGFNRSDPIEVNIWTQGTIVISSKKAKGTPFSSLLHQSLINDEIDIYVPKSPKFELEVNPLSFKVSDGSVTTLNVSAMMKMTTKAKIPLVIVLEKKKIYSSIDLILRSKPSPWVDLDKIKLTGEVLGQGGFGVVKRGVYKGQDVAVKLLLTQDLNDETKKEFEREVSLMKNLHHPNIIQFIGASNVEGKLALVTEFAPLGSLGTLLVREDIPYNIKLVIVLEIARAIKFLHSNNIIHRDVKPPNILVFSLEPKATVHVKLTDFGTSKFVPDTSSVNMTKYTGTAKYMAPETFGVDPRFTLSADIYSFGLLMWEVMTGLDAFSEKKYMWQSKIEKFVLSGKRMPIPEEMDPRLASIIEQCWGQDPTKRPSITHVIQLLSALVYG